MINSLSSSLICGITLLRNQNDGMGSKVLGGVGYALAATVAVVESVAAAAFFLLSIGTMIIGCREPISFAVKWLSSSAFSLGWSIANCILNPMCHTLVADERSAREILNSGNLFLIPPNAVLRLP